MVVTLLEAYLGAWLVLKSIWVMVCAQVYLGVWLVLKSILGHGLCSSLSRGPVPFQIAARVLGVFVPFRSIDECSQRGGKT